MKALLTTILSAGIAASMMSEPDHSKVVTMLQNKQYKEEMKSSPYGEKAFEIIKTKLKNMGIMVLKCA